jgi:phosphoglycerate dehydrogenase-like enzyme
MPGLRWIQFISAGVDEWAENSLISPDVVVTNTKNLYADSVADYMIWALLTLTRKFDVVVINQTKRRWQQISGPTLRGKTIGILGVGSVGRALAKRATAFDMKTIGVMSEDSAQQELPFIDKSVPVNDLHHAIAEFDVLAVCVPLTDATRGLLDSNLIAKMKPNAYLINISRAEIVDDSAVATALKNKRLAGAVLDVFHREPLRRWSSLWKTDNLIITPHVSGLTDDYRERVGGLICQNVDRFSAGEKLLNIVDPEKRY